jgi:dienelactone hydrolase
MLNARLLIRDIVEHSDSAVFRMDKPGVGDSEGVCSTTDFATELESYRRAFAALRTDARINPSRIVVVGISNGGGVAPLVAKDADVAGPILPDCGTTSPTPSMGARQRSITSFSVSIWQRRGPGK